MMDPAATAHDLYMSGAISGNAAPTMAPVNQTGWPGNGDFTADVQPILDAPFFRTNGEPMNFGNAEQPQLSTTYQNPAEEFGLMTAPSSNTDITATVGHNGRPSQSSTPISSSREERLLRTNDRLKVKHKMEIDAIKAELRLARDSLEQQLRATSDERKRLERLERKLNAIQEKIDELDRSETGPIDVFEFVRQIQEILDEELNVASMASAPTFRELVA